MLGDLLADCVCAFFIAAVCFKVLFHGRSGGKGHAVDVIDQLCVDVLRRAEYIQAGTLRGSGDLVTDTVVPFQTSLMLPAF